MNMSSIKSDLLLLDRLDSALIKTRKLNVVRKLKIQQENKEQQAINDATINMSYPDIDIDSVISQIESKFSRLIDMAQLRVAMWRGNIIDSQVLLRMAHTYRGGRSIRDPSDAGRILAWLRDAQVINPIKFCGFLGWPWLGLQYKNTESLKESDRYVEAYWSYHVRVDLPGLGEADG